VEPVALRGVERWRRTGIPQLLVLAPALAGAAIALAGARAARGLSGARARRFADAAERRAMQRIARALGRLKGPFAKLGQFGAVHLDVLPASASSALAPLRDRVPPVAFERIRAVVEAELGRPLESAFAEFAREPLGAASIAQAHLARLPTGEAVVVKVQYPWLADSLDTDLRIARGLLVALGATRRARGGADALFREFADCLREELDFEREARVAGEIAANLAADAAVVVPEVVTPLSTRRVLTMRHHPAVGLSDAAGLARIGVAPGALVEILARAYSSQVFADGLFHADPHPGNLFVIDEPGAARQPRLLFVDFGLSRRLDPALRRELRDGIHALLRRDLPAFLDGMERIGAIAPGHRDDVARAVASMFERIARAGGGLALGGSAVLSLKAEAVALLRETPGLRIPIDLLLYAKTLAYVFALGAQLDPSVDMMKQCLPSLLRFLTEKE
jgi:predicted unusual protein kinase regulating ubiquinone biosynthesis (AarF/ABC1/UbiB family)